MSIALNVKVANSFSTENRDTAKRQIAVLQPSFKSQKEILLQQSGDKAANPPIAMCALIGCLTARLFNGNGFG